MSSERAAPDILPEMVSQPSVSVVIPTCNRPHFLQAALASVFAQERLPQEVIVVDDGAASSLLPAAGELRCPGDSQPGGCVPLRVIAGPKRGPGAARNAGIAAARGDLIAFLDDDDLWHPQKVARQVCWFESRLRLGLLGAGVVRAAEAAGLEGILAGKCARPRTVGRAALVKANRFVTSSVIVRRECVEECGGFDESLELAQDWDMWLRIAERWKAATLPGRLTWYRLHGGQRSASSLEMRSWEAEVVRRAREREGARGRLRGVARRRLAWAHCRLGRALLREGRTAGAAQALRASVQLHPLALLAWAGLARCWIGKHRLAGAHEI